ncbi:MAG: hypothetical protein ACFFB0_02480 [Promethearchaeota archaeon]
MSTERKVDVFAALILVLSLIGLILLAALDFAAFYLPNYGTRYSCLGCEYSTSGDLAAQIIILILLIIQILIALNDLLPNKFIKKDLEKYGMFLAVATVLFAIIGISSFGAEYGDYDWWAAEGFWGSIIAGLLNTILFFLKYRNK